VGFQIDQPLFLLLVIPVFFGLFLYWKTIKHSSLLEKRTIITLRSLIVSCIILALCMPNITFPVKGVTTVFVVDHSDSVRNQEDDMYGAIEEAIEKMREDDRYAIVSVAEEGQIMQTISSRNKGIIQTKAMEKTAFTNLEEGLQLAASLLSSNSSGRIVLLTDGNENMGDVKRQVNLLSAQDIEIDVIPFSTAVKQDVLLENFQIPNNLFLGEETTISLTVNSTLDTTSRIRIRKNNEVIIDEQVSVKQGKNAFSFDYVIESTGTHSFQAEIITEDDSILQNNVGYAIANVKGTPMVLLVEGVQGEGRNVEKVFQSSDLYVETIQPLLLPTSLTGLLDYQTIIFNNVSATDVTQEQMEIIESAVKDFGVGFMMTGGNQSFGLGGYFKTPIEKLLPVEMDLKGKKELPSLGMVIVLDRSGSMAGYKLDLAKEAAARSVELLREKDTLGFIAFDDRPWQIIDTEVIGDKEEAAEKIRSVTEGGGTDIFPALELAFEQLEPLELKRKHIILLTDGQSATNNDYFELIDEGLKNNVTLSTVAIGSDADRVLLEQLAEEGTGRFYDVQDASTIPSILSRETILTTRTYIEDNPFYPNFYSGTNWDFIFQDGVPEMNAYVATDPKPRAEKILESEKGDPILIRWQYGLGNTIAWTTDVRGEWAGGWPLWERWPVLWNEMLSWSLPSYQQQLYDIEQTINGREVTLNVTSDHPDLLPVEVKVVDEKGNEQASEIRPTAPGEHEVTFNADTGIYFVNLSKIDNTLVTSTYQTSVVVPYSKEFELTRENNQLLQEIVDMSDGKILENPGDAFRDLDRKTREKQPVYMQLLLVAFLLFFLEIAIRRFGIQQLLDKMKMSHRNQEKSQKAKKEKIEQTFDQLKKAKTTNKKQKSRTTQTAIPVKETLDSRKKDGNKDIGKQNPSIQSNMDEASTGNQDRMKRLLEAKNRKTNS
jgi:Ca-activated chloride channel homolog